MLIAEIEKNMKEKIKISIEEYRGFKFIDCRVYFEDDLGLWHATRKGIALNDETVAEVIEALKKAVPVLQGRK